MTKGQKGWEIYYVCPCCKKISNTAKIMDRVMIEYDLTPYIKKGVVYVSEKRIITGDGEFCGSELPCGCDLSDSYINDYVIGIRGEEVCFYDGNDEQLKDLFEVETNEELLKAIRKNALREMLEIKVES